MVVQGKGVVTAEVSSGTELWAIWAGIALSQLELARQGRTAIADCIKQGVALDLNAELEPAMIAIAAAATALDGFATVVEETGIEVQSPEVDSPTRAHHIWEILRAGFDVGSKTNVWPRDIKELFMLRSDRTAGGLLHPKTVFGAPAEHPLVTGVSPARALYTLEAAEAAVNLIADVFATCMVSVRPGHPALDSRIKGLLAILDGLSQPPLRG